ncbi:PREDICTED: origin recognition complex subunit 2 [Hipposideros armiger]|uniref:Origin recognition complex subunit 2 n=1 Tax=Hipposideros armiger TaxID=186990 RepID=A0A8B7QQU3_HIPAR|nr:PREDICTED: origin recognition complex subunit 2 [Hipposideros armiger]
MMNKLELMEDKMLEVQFVGDDDVLNHILDREGGAKLKKERPQLLVNTKKIIKKPEHDLEEDDHEVLKDQNCVQVLGQNLQESLKNGSATDGGNKVYSFQNRKHPEKMAKLASELANTPRKNVSFNLKNDPEVMINIPQCSKGHSTSDKVQLKLKKNDKSEILSTAPSGLRKTLIVPRSHSDSESEYSASNSEDDEGAAQEYEEDTNEVILSQKSQAQNRVDSTPVCKEIPSKKMKRDKTSDLIEEYFEAHSSSKVLTSDRTLQKLKRAKLDQLRALVWDHVKQSLYNWLWYETTTYSPYTEETSYENSLLVKQSGSLPLSSLTHVLRSLTPNARGIFRLLIKYQLDNQDNPSYIGLSFQDFYQQCREAFLVNSDLTLRAQLTEFRDHKLIRTKKGSDGVEYLLIPIDNGTLTDFLEKEEESS